MGEEIRAGEDDEEIVGCIMSKLERHNSRLFPPAYRGYLGMLAVRADFRGRKIAKTLVKLTLKEMQAEGAHEIVLETEETNTGAIGLYEGLGFIRHKKLPRYYLNGVDAYRYKYLFPDPEYIEDIRMEEEMPARKQGG